MEEIQKSIQKAIEINIEKEINDILNKPIYEFVATYDAGIFTRHIKH